MSWTAHGLHRDGFLLATLPGTDGASSAEESGRWSATSVPAVAAHRGRLWCLWASPDSGDLYYSFTGATPNPLTGELEFGARRDFPADGLPVLAELNGQLHAVVALSGRGSGPGHEGGERLVTGELLHYVFDDGDEGDAAGEEGGGGVGWKLLGPLDAAAGVLTLSSPALVAFHNKLFLAYLGPGRQLFFVVWSAETSQWTAPLLLDDDGSAAEFTGIPALFVIGGVLHTLCEAAPVGAGDGAAAITAATTTTTTSREIVGFRFDYIANTWAQTDDITEGRAVSGVSAASFGDSAYLGFIEKGGVSGDGYAVQGGGGDGDDSVRVAAFTGGAWHAHEAVCGERAATPPQLAVLAGRLHCVFASAVMDGLRRLLRLRWFSRPLLDGYTYSDWMARVPDATALSDLTVPGTHDSCARSNIPFVRTQYLSVAQQLRLGIRFIDLRLRVRGDGGGGGGGGEGSGGDGGNGGGGDDDDAGAEWKGADGKLPNPGNLWCYHGGVPIDYPRGLSLAAVMDEVWTFLRPPIPPLPGGGASVADPPQQLAPATETLLISINNDDVSPAALADPSRFYDAVAAFISGTPAWPDSGGARWFTGAGTPTLGDVRGKAVLLRRYPAAAEAVAAADAADLDGLDLSGWLNDNPSFSLVTPTKVTVHLQDKWKFGERIALVDLVRTKLGFVTALMERAVDGGAGGGGGQEAEEAEAAQQRGGDWFVNFMSAVGVPGTHSAEVAEAKWIAVGAHSHWIGKWVDGMNVEVRRYLLAQFGGAEQAPRKWRLGVVNLDYPELPGDNDVVARLIETNFAV